LKQFGGDFKKIVGSPGHCVHGEWLGVECLNCEYDATPIEKTQEEKIQDIKLWLQKERLIKDVL
jgi:hypothetical protein